MNLTTKPLSLNSRVFFLVAPIATLVLLIIATCHYFGFFSPAANFPLYLWILLFAGLQSTIWLSANAATKCTRSLVKELASIQNSGDAKLRVTESGPREIVTLAKEINAVLDEAERMTVSEQAHRTNEERLAVAVEGTNDGLWDWNVQTGEVWYADRFKELLGYENFEAEFPDTIDSFKEHFHPDDSEATWDAFQNHIENYQALDTEQRVRRRRGSYRWFRIRAAVVRDAAGKVRRMSGSIRDVTERKKFEEALQQSNEDLEQFAVIASHDLQEPLRKVTSFCGLLQRDYSSRLDDEGRQYLDFAIDGAKRMRTLVQDLLLFSKIGSETTSNQPVDSEAALELAMLNLETAIKDSGADVTFDDLPKVIAKNRELAQLFQNLIGNAIKYRSKKAPKIHVGVSSADRCWQFSVADNGIGIKPEFQERIFRVFQRLHSRNEYSGTGIGLAICKRVVEQLGGKIWVDSNPEQGCTFYFTIPKKKTSIYDSIRLDDYV